MVSKKGGRFIATIVTMASFITIAWFSCTKVGANLSTCNGVLCHNFGYCVVDTFTKKPKCHCPVGFEGPNCATASVEKYVGTWDMMQVTTGSDSMKYDAFNNKIIDTTYYQVILKKSATPTTFFIYNFKNNTDYNNIICRLDTLDKLHFVVDTASSHQLMFDHFKLVSGHGYITTNDTGIAGQMITRHLTVSSNWVNDTFDLYLTKRNP